MFIEYIHLHFAKALDHGSICQRCWHRGVPVQRDDEEVLLLRAEPQVAGGASGDGSDHGSAPRAALSKSFFLMIVDLKSTNIDEYRR